MYNLKQKFEVEDILQDWVCFHGVPKESKSGSGKLLSDVKHKLCNYCCIEVNNTTLV